MLKKMHLKITIIRVRIKFEIIILIKFFAGYNLRLLVAQYLYNVKVGCVVC